MHDEAAKARAAAFAQAIAEWDGPKLAADLLYEHYGSARPLEKRHALDKTPLAPRP